MTDPMAALQAAVIRHNAGDHAAAEAGYHAVLALLPDEPNARHLLGLLLCERDAFDEGLALLAAVRAGHPDIAAIAYNHANMLLRAGHLEQALDAYDATLVLQPDFVEVHANRARTLLELNRPQAALEAADTGLARMPLDLGLHLVRSEALQELGCGAEALEACDAAAAVAPQDPAVAIHRATLLQALGDASGALTCFARAEALQPHHAPTLTGYARLLQERGDPQAALPLFDRAIAADPHHAAARWNGRMCRLLLGDDAAWPFDWTDASSQRPRRFDMPVWDGTTALDGRRILLHIDQGLGDTLQLCRFVRLVAAAGAEIVLEVQPQLVRLLARSWASPPVRCTVIAQGDQIPPVDCHCSLFDLPHRFGVTSATMAPVMPYLSADPTLWRTRVARLPGLRVGLVWAGSARVERRQLMRVDRMRSLRLATLAPLARVSGVTFVSLQKGPPAAQRLAQPAFGIVDWTDELNDFADTADLVACLDLVISVDTSTAHVAGAIGVPVWLLNRMDTCWRWGHGTEGTPWYPSLRQFRQSAPGDWNGVVERLSFALAETATA